MKPTMTKASSMSEEPVQARDVGGIQSGSCTPCIFWVSARGCARANCDFAHLRHHPKPEDYVRPRRAKRDAMKQTIFEHFLVPDEDDRHRLLQEEAAKHPFARNFVKGLLDNLAFNVRTVGQDVVVSL
ncbi:unnamed protein product [Durusdinium trenchii]|uniref:Reticulocyte-binding protein 2-like a n=2 Tax=Durusdinium trenchii TaxID=1381693 RepID=A0ABP0QKX7_9DINO